MQTNIKLDLILRLILLYVILVYICVICMLYKKRIRGGYACTICFSIFRGIRIAELLGKSNVTKS